MTLTQPLSAAPVLAFGFVLGLKHAVEADHLAAVSAIVSERKSLWSSSLVGGLWGIGHTISLLIAGVVVILFHFEIGERTERALEFMVGLMLVALGANALRKLARGGHVHLHTHRHGGREHIHPHVHDGAPETEPQTHHGLRLSPRPLFVGMVHGLAGSAALTLLVLSTIPSPAVGLLYLVVFGVGSAGGMMLMSALFGLPFYLTAARFARAHLAVRGLAGLFSLGLGLFTVYEVGFVDGLFR
jgi:sulfite exporter TauE/SafE